MIPFVFLAAWMLAGVVVACLASTDERAARCPLAMILGPFALIIELERAEPAAIETEDPTARKVDR